jgi:hypothetical protein
MELTLFHSVFDPTKPHVHIPWQWCCQFEVVWLVVDVPFLPMLFITLLLILRSETLILFLLLLLMTSRV